jgi:hypothetical protein
MRTIRVVKSICLLSLAAVLGASRPAGAQQPLKLLAIAGCGGFDTRQPGGPTGGQPLQSGTIYSFTLKGTSCVPQGAKAVALYVLAISPTGPGQIEVWPAGSSPPYVSMVNFDGPSSGAIGVQVMVPLPATTPDISFGAYVGGAAPNTVHLIIFPEGVFQ